MLSVASSAGGMSRSDAMSSSSGFFRFFAMGLTGGGALAVFHMPRVSSDFSCLGEGTAIGGGTGEPP
eukprot:38051-Eustigmatos_ZCMA.PRE.1